MDNRARAAAATPPAGILPPYLLVRLSRSGDPDVATPARQTLRVERSMRVRREMRSARRPDGRRGGPGAAPGATGAPGIIPDTLRRRVEPGAERRRHATRPRPEPPREVAPKRSVHDAEHGTALPGVLRRAEGAPPHADESVNEAYDGLGATWGFLQEAYGRDSLDGAGLPLVASVHFERHYDNAFWDGEQMVFGDGDGKLFRSFTDSLDVIAHELAHGFTQYTRGFVYVGQSGALNEHISDVLGVLTVQYSLRQTAGQADWLVGAGLFTDRVRGVALRSMKAPGTAYDDPVLGRDPQPAHLRDYQKMPHDEEHDNGGVHINSGIPNHAFYLAATALGGFAWEHAGQVWYDVMTASSLPKDVGFAGFAGGTLAAAVTRYGDSSRPVTAIAEAWRGVGVEPVGDVSGPEVDHQAPVTRAAGRGGP